MNEEQINAARAAYQRDPETACQALLGCSAEEMFITALRGCNQHKHKPGCPEANGGGVNSGDFERILKSYEAKSPEARKQEREAQLKRTLRDYEHAVGESASDSEVEKLWKDHTDTEALYNSLDERLAKKERGRGSDKSWDEKPTAEKLKSALATQKKAREKAESNYSEENRGMLNAANARVDKYERKLLEEETELFKGASYVQKHRDENFTSSTKTVGLNDAREFARGDGYRRYKNKGGNLVVYSPSSGYELIFDDKKLAILAESPNA